MTLLIGLLFKELSPLRIALILLEEINPARSLIPVPELPKSNCFLVEIVLQEVFQILDIFHLFLICALIHRFTIVLITSSPSSKLVISDLPTAWPVKIRDL